MHKIIFKDADGQKLTLKKEKPYLFLQLNGIGVSSNVTASSGARHGVKVDYVNIKEKTLVVLGAIVANSKREMQEKRERLISFLAPDKKISLYHYNKRFKRKVNVVIRSLDFQEEVGGCQKFQIQALAPSPFWNEETERRKDIALWSKDLYFPMWCTEDKSVKPIVFGHRISELICNVYNDGDTPSGMTIQLRALATVTNPSVLNIYTKEQLKVMTTLHKGDVLEISTYSDNKYVRIYNADGTSKNVLHWLTLQSEFIQLRKGDNQLRYDAESGIDNLEMTINYAPGFLGI